MKKPVPREAEQLTADHVLGVRPLPEGITRELVGDPDSALGQRVRFFVVTAHGNKAYLGVGDYAVKEPNGDGFYPCLKAIFEAEHDRLDG
jgi:hypothetical protein